MSGKKGRVFLRGITSETYGLKEFRRSSSTHRGSGTTRWSWTTEGRALRRRGQQSRRWWRVGPGDEQFLTQSLQVHFVEMPRHGLQQRPRPPERGGLLHPRGRRLRDPRRPALRLEEGRSRLRPHRLGAPALQPVRRQGALLIFKAKSTWMYMGLIQQGRGGPIDDRTVRAARGLVAHLDAGRPRPQEGRQARGHRVGAQPARQGTASCTARRPTCVSSASTSIELDDSCGQPLRQALEHGRRDALRPRGRGLQPALGGRGGDRREVLRAHRQGADPARVQGGRHPLRAAEHRRAALRRRRQPLS